MPTLHHETVTTFEPYIGIYSQTMGLDKAVTPCDFRDETMTGENQH